MALPYRLEMAYITSKQEILVILLTRSSHFISNFCSTFSLDSNQYKFESENYNINNEYIDYIAKWEYEDYIEEKDIEAWTKNSI